MKINLHILFSYIIYLIINFKFNINGQITSDGAITRFSPGGQYIVLTFSGGPHHIITPKILDILKHKHVKATFFISGLKAIYHKDILKNMYQGGHDLANQGFHAVLFTSLSNDDIINNVKKTSQIISNVTNQDVKYVRPPKGLTNIDVNEIIKTNCNMKVILWSLNGHDAIEKNPNVILNNIINKTKPGDIILLHDINMHTVEALPAMIDILHTEGYEFLTLTQILSFPDDSPH